MKRLSGFVVFCLILCSECTPVIYSKMNAPLRQQLNRAEEEIRFAGECQNELTSKIRDRIENCGIRIQTVNGAFFTASGTPYQIRKLSRLECIIRLESGSDYRYKMHEESP